MGEDKAAGGGRAFGLVREASVPPIHEQEARIMEYAKEKGLKIEDVLLVPWERRFIVHVYIYYLLNAAKPDILIIHSWRVLGSTCRVLVRNISAIFRAGVKELHTVEGDVITREEWDKHLPFLSRFAREASYKKRVDPSLVEKIMELVPLSLEEAVAIYNALIKNDKTKLEIITDLRSITREAAGKELVDAELEDRSVDEGMLPRLRKPP